MQASGAQADTTAGQDSRKRTELEQLKNVVGGGASSTRKVRLRPCSWWILSTLARYMLCNM